MAVKKDRQQLEAGLKQAGESINRRVSSLERVVRPPGVEAGLRMGRKIAGNPMARTGLIVGAGAVVGWLLGGIGSGKRRRNRDWAGSVADDVVRRHEDGSDLRDAVRRSLRDHEAPDSGGERGGLMSFLLGYAVRTGAQTLARSLFSEFSRRRDDSA